MSCCNYSATGAVGLWQLLQLHEANVAPWRYAVAVRIQFMSPTSLEGPHRWQVKDCTYSCLPQLLLLYVLLQQTGAAQPPYRRSSRRVSAYRSTLTLWWLCSCSTASFRVRSVPSESSIPMLLLVLVALGHFAYRQQHACHPALPSATPRQQT